MPHEYPSDLARAVHQAWPDDAPVDPVPLPTLEAILSVCFLASLQREEARPVTFRLVLADPEGLDMDQGPPAGVQVLPFQEPLDFSPNTLRRLTPAVEYHRAMVCIRTGGDTSHIWGLMHTGTGWTRESDGGRRQGHDEQQPERMVVHVTSPGEISVWYGTLQLATLRGGRVVRDQLDVFRSRWLPDHFAAVRSEAMTIHESRRTETSDVWA